MKVYILMRFPSMRNKNLCIICGVFSTHELADKASDKIAFAPDTRGSIKFRIVEVDQDDIVEIK